jgi:amino acid adenylation domain-containing protein
LNRKDELLAHVLKREGFERQSDYTIPLRDNDEAPPPLSFAQERFWFLDQFEHAHPVYNGCKVVRLIGQLSVKVLAECLNLIVRRHEVLRTTYPAPDGRPIQRVAVACPIEISVTDLEHASESDLPFAIERLARNEWLQPINLSEELPIRARLVRIDHARNLLILTLHQIAFDSRAVAIFFRELWTAYKDKLHGKEPELPALPVQYGDFANWQRHRVSGQTFQSQREYWIQRLSGTLPFFDLPADKPRPPVQAFDGSRLSVQLPETLQLKLKELSQENGVTLFMTLLAAFKTLLYRYTAQEDLIVGCPVLNRRLPETENLLGSFVNTLVLRTNYAGNPSFREALRRVRETCLGAFAHQDFPFEKLVEELHPQRDLARNPIFQVMFAFQNTSVPTLELAGLRSEAVDIDGGMTKFDLTFSLIDKEDGIVGHIEYSTDLFHRDTIERMSRHFQTLLEGIAIDPDQPIATLPIMTEPERRQILFEWNDTAADYSKNKCIHELFEEQVDRTPDAIALEYQDKRISYRELNRKANQLAHYLISLGIGPEKLVGICVERSIEMVVGLMGILKAGGGYLPLDPSYPQERLAFMMQDVALSVVVTQERFVENGRLRIEDSDSRSSSLYSQSSVVCLDRDWPVIEQKSRENPKIQGSPNDLAYVIYTSGSTGEPKGVQVSHRSIINCLVSIGKRIGLISQDRLLAVTTISFDIAALELYLPLLVGGTVVVASREEATDGIELVRRVKDSSGTVMQGTPSTWRMLIKAGWEGSLGFKILCGGEALSRQLADQLLDRGSVWNLYGPTESTIWSTMAKVEANDKPIPIGRPIANTQIYIRDTYLQPVPIGIPGDLCIGGDGLARGYLNRPEQTPEKFIPNPFSDNSNSRLYRTGDRAKYLDDGNIEFLGRVDNQVKIRGFRIEPGEIEVALNQHPAVHESVVVTQDEVTEEERSATNPKSKIENPNLNERLVAYVVPNQPPMPSVTELHSYLRQKLPEYMIPSMFVTLDAIPLTPNGKVDRNALPPPNGARPQLVDEFVAPRTPVEELLAGIWAEVLRRDRVGVHDNFFHLGGHSLVAARVISRIRNAFQIELPLRRIFETPTIADLARAVEAGLQNGQTLERAPILPQVREGYVPPSVAQEPLLLLERLFPGINLFNIPASFRLKGPLNLAALEDSLNRVVERHEALRTTFPTVSGQHVQFVSPSVSIKLEPVDLGILPDKDREAEMKRLAREEAEQPFDVKNGPLFRAKLLRMGDQDHILLIIMHHVISDGGSMVMFFRDLAAFYEAYGNQCPPSLPELPIQYADFAQWQRQALNGKLMETQFAYWKQQLSGPLAPLEFYPGRSRVGELGFLTARKSVSISRDLFESLKKLSQREESTLYMTLLTALAILLHCHTGQEDVRIGTMVENRNRIETENLIGHFANTLIIRTKLSSDASFHQLARQVRDMALVAYTHQDLPFEVLAQALEHEESLDRASVCPMMFIYQTAGAQSVKVPGLTVEVLDDIRNTEAPDLTITTFDLILLLKERLDGVVGSLIYKVDLFDEDGINRVLGHFYDILQGIISEPDQPVSEFCSLG